MLEKLILELSSLAESVGWISDCINGLLLDTAIAFTCKAYESQVYCNSIWNHFQLLKSQIAPGRVLRLNFLHFTQTNVEGGLVNFVKKHQSHNLTSALVHYEILCGILCIHGIIITHAQISFSRSYCPSKLIKGQTYYLCRCASSRKSYGL